MSLRSRSLSAALAAAVTLSGPAPAAELILGLGHDGRLGGGESGFAAAIGVASGPLTALGPVDLALGGALEADDDGDGWAGAGLVAIWPIPAALRLSASVMAGGYIHGNGDDLGGPVQFRSRLGLDRALGDRTWRVGLAIEHKSNANLEDYNPGVETVFVTLGRSF